MSRILPKGTPRLSGSVLILGANGQLGRELVAQLRSDHDCAFAAYDLPELDITKADHLREAVTRHRPNCIINCAALTNVDACELQPRAAMAINAEPVAVLAEMCDGMSCRLIQLSTDFVFDGTLGRPYREDDRPCPPNVYGRAKLAAETYVRGCRRHLVVRTACLFGPGTGNFVARVLGKALTGERLRIVDDRTGSPTYCPDLARAIFTLIRLDLDGIYHVVNAGKASWYALAKRAVELAHLDTSIQPISASEYPTPAARPALSALDTSRYEKATGRRLRDWQVVLTEYIESRAWLPGGTA